MYYIGPDPPMDGAIFSGMDMPVHGVHARKHSAVSCTKMAEHVEMLFMAALCNRGAIIFLPCDFYLSIYLLLFPRLISAAAGWMSTIL